MADIVKSNAGRPMLYSSEEELRKVINEYFDWCDNRIKEIHTKEGEVIAITHPAPYTMSGLARRLGMSRETLVQYGRKEQFSDTIKDARSRVQEDIENRLMETSNQAGAIFNLKNNFGWKDKSEVENTIKLPQPILGGMSDVSDNDRIEEATQTS